MKNSKYDLIVIGSGSGGLGVSLGLLELGLKVLLIDKSAEKIGGECLNTGCVPSKAIIHVAKTIFEAKQAENFGLQVSGSISLNKIHHYIREKQDTIRKHENVDYLMKKGLEVVLGKAQFHTKSSVLVNDTEYRAKNIVIATGSQPRQLKIKGLETIEAYTNESIFQIAKIPKVFLFIGAGPVSMELGQVFSRLGSKVLVVDRGPHILKKEDEVISKVLFDRLKKEGIEFYLDSEVTEIVPEGQALIKHKNGKVTPVLIDAVFMGVGRVLNFEELHMENAGIVMEKGKIKLDERLRTSNKNIFVSGDAADNMKFSHAAEMHTGILLNNFISPFKKKLNLDHFPWVTFTDPEVATFGLGEKQLKDRKMDFERLETDFSEDDRAITDNYRYSKLVLFVEKKAFAGSAKILGGSMAAPHAGEITQELILANTYGLSLKKIMDKIYAYPTESNINKVLIRKRVVKEIKPWMKGLLRRLYKI